jgi:glycosyltransferase involved in cell wall biosynthesis
MQKTVIFIRSMPLDRDSRSGKMIAEYERRGFRVLRLIWTRGDPIGSTPETIAFTGAGGYGRKLRNAAVRIRWNAFILRELLRRRADYSVVHMVDLDTSWVALPVARALGKLAVYDAYDHFSAFLFSRENAVARMIATLERRAIGAADVTVFPDPARLDQYGIRESDRICFIGNIPDGASLMEDDARIPSSAAPLTFVYVGTLEPVHRGLEFIPRLCADLGASIRFVVSGVGPLETLFRSEQERLPNLTFLGHLGYAEALRRMAEADVLFGPYLLTTSAHRFAVPNKMYEHLAVGRPLVTNSGIPPATLVEAEDSGFLFDGSYNDLRAVVAGLTREECSRRGACAAQAWRLRYSTLRARQVEAFFAKLGSLLKLRSAQG